MAPDHRQSAAALPRWWIRCMLVQGALLIAAALAACGGGAAAGPASAPPPALATGVQLAAGDGLAGRVIAGYQGWFGCPGDFGGNRDWIHWFDRVAAPDRLTVDQLPAVAGFAAEDLCDTGLRRTDGTPVRVFSSQNANVVARHFGWMQEHGIDGVAFQRFVSETRAPVPRSRSDNVLGHVRRSAEGTGRVFYVAYDISGDADDAADAIRRDWQYLASALDLTASPAYLRVRGKPVVQLWGFGFRDRPGSAASAAQLIADLRGGLAGLPAATVVGGVPSRWRTLGTDSKPDPAWAAVYRSYDVISPWTVGRYRDADGALAFAATVVEPDLAEAKRAGIGYLPVVFPGFSWRNLMAVRGTQAPFNQVPRDCGRFLWQQLAAMAGTGAVYAAMFDEVDEGTALFKLETAADAAPAGAQTLATGADGCTLPDDWYLRVLGRAAGFLRERIPLPATLPDAGLHPD